MVHNNLGFQVTQHTTGMDFETPDLPVGQISVRPIKLSLSHVHEEAKAEGFQDRLRVIIVIRFAHDHAELSRKLPS